MLVGGVYKILGHDATGHLQARHVAVEPAAHLGAVEATGSTQFARYQTAVLGQRQQDSLIDAALHRRRLRSAAIVAKVGPPLLAHKARLARKELAIDAASLGDDGALPLP